MRKLLKVPDVTSDIDLLEAPVLEWNDEDTLLELGFLSTFQDNVTV